MSSDQIKKRKNNYLQNESLEPREEQKISSNDYIQVQNHMAEEEFEDVADEDDDFFEANDKDMIDKNLQEPYGDDDNDDDDDQDANEDGLDIDQSSQEGDEQIPAEKPHQT
jgi:hypothetical protein